MVVTNYRITLPVGKKIRAVIAADLHSSPAADFIADEIGRISPDVILVPGDLCHTPDEPAVGVRFLQKCVKIAPVYYAFGNHERTADESIFAVDGVHIVNNRYERFGDICIGGLRSGFVGQHETAFTDTPAPDKDFLDRFEGLHGAKILLSHHPEYYPKHLKDRDLGLIVSGHAHGGQWRIFGRGVFAPGQGLFPKYTSGLIDGKMIVSRGLANTVPIPRFFNPTELVVAEIVTV